MILFASFFIVRTIKLLESDDPVIQHTIVNNEGEEIDLWKLGYFFAITEIDPRIATLKVTHTSWDPELGKKKNPVELTNCVNYMEGGKYADIVTKRQREFLVGV